MLRCKSMIVLILAATATGCAVTQPAEPPALANTARAQIGHLSTSSAPRRCGSTSGQIR